MEFRPLISEAQIEEIRELSQSLKAVVIFKHSTRCAISSMALSRFKRGWVGTDSDTPVYYLDLIRYPSVSKAVAQVFGVRHESPQVLLIRDGKCVYDASHNAIMPARIMEELEYA